MLLQELKTVRNKLGIRIKETQRKIKQLQSEIKEKQSWINQDEKEIAKIRKIIAGLESQNSTDSKT